MALARPMVSTQLGCDGFPFADNREVRFADTPDEFAGKALDLLNDRERAAALGATARAFVEQHFGWDAIVPRLEPVYAP
jgi:glycosyltransferase involved in cell wall biosynthesis